ncbi:MAG: SDR family oxidoreductase [Hyphomicrobiaceae bacterium]
MRILITGNMGYVGPVLVRSLRASFPAAELIGYDAGFFGNLLTDAERLPESCLNAQHFGDIRDLPERLLAGVDAVIHLAAVSNDPIGNRFEGMTDEINQTASVRVALLSAKAGVKNFVFASSCSIYGASAGGARTEQDETNPLTAYARSKIGTETALAATDLGSMVVTSLRFATACGMSDRLRLDLVLNDFVACALTSGEITVLSDGSPWRPLIDVADMARAMTWAIARSADNGGKFLVVNAGSSACNYQIKNVANAVAAAVPGTKVSINTDAPPDKRSYSVNFDLFASLAPDFTPRVTLDQSIQNLRDGLVRMGFSDREFRASKLMRLKAIEQHIATGRLGADLRWL